jgi:hypothetical protein
VVRSSLSGTADSLDVAREFPEHRPDVVGAEWRDYRVPADEATFRGH